MALTGAWADVLELTPANGTYVTSSGNYVNSITFSTTPAITVSVSANNMDKRQTGDFLLWHSGTAGSCTYTFSVGDGYVITDYTVTGYANTSAQTLTAGSNSHEFAVGTSSTFSVTGLSSSSTSFVQTGANASGLKITSMTVTVVKPTEEQTAAYNTVQGWITTIQSAEGLVTDASNYTSNAKESSEGTYPALLDGIYETYFHSSWNNAPNEDHYLQATLPEAVDAFYFYFKKRSQNQANRPTSITISGSNDGSNFTEVTTINSGLPTANDVLDYASSKINLGASYKYIRFTVTATNTGAKANNHVFFTFSEFYILPSNEHVDDAMTFYLSGKKALDYTADDIAQVNATDLEIRSATLAPSKANVIATYTIPDGKAGTTGYPTVDAWNTFVATINGITIEDDFDAIKNAAIDALLASAKLADGVYMIRNYSTNHYLYQDEVDGIVTYATPETPAGNHGYWRVTDNGDGTYSILDLYGHQLTRGNQSQGWAGVQNGNRTAVTTITHDYTNSNYKTSGDLVSFYLAGAHINTGYNTGSKVFVTTWTNGGLESDANHWFFEPVDVSELTAYTITVAGAPDAVVMGDGTAVANGTATVYLSGTDQILAPEVENYEVSKEVEGTTATITYTVTDYEALVAAYMTEDKLNNVMNAGKLGYRAAGTEAYNNLYTLLSTFIPGHTYTASDYENIQTYYEAFINSAITLPVSGKFYRFTSTHETYLSGNASTAQAGRLSFITSADASTIFYFDGEKLYDLANGRAAAGRAVGTAGGAGITYWFEESTITAGKYAIRFNPDGGADRFLFAWDTSKNYADQNGADAANCVFTIEEITTLPVNISAAGYATLYSPVALTIPSGVEAYTGVVEKTWLDMSMVESKIPANTAVILVGDQGSYEFETTTADDFEGDNVLKGTIGGKAGVANSILTLQNIGEVGLYTYTGETLAGFKAYMDMPGAEVKGLTFKFDNATGINGVDAAAQNGTIYNLAGQRVQKAQKGIYIVNGKKVLF